MFRSHAMVAKMTVAVNVSLVRPCLKSHPVQEKPLQKLVRHQRLVHQPELVPHLLKNYVMTEQMRMQIINSR